MTVPKDHCVQVPWEYVNVCGYSDEFCKLPHTYIHILRTYYVHTTYYILHTTYRISDHIVSLRRDKNTVLSARSFNPCSSGFAWNQLPRVGIDNISNDVVTIPEYVDISL